MSLLHDLQEQSPLQQKLHQLLHTLQTRRRPMADGQNMIDALIRRLQAG